MEKRSLKFRAWDKGHNKMSYKVNLYSMNRSGEIDKAQIDNQNYMKAIGFQCEVMQFIGLEDLQGKEIYEDDIVSQFDGVIRTFTGRVVFLNGQFCLHTPNQWPCYTPLSKEAKVMGNIHEHPELLASLTA